MISEQFCQWLEDNNFGTYGTDIFDTFIPNSPDNLIMVEDVSAPNISESSSLKIDLFAIKINVRNLVTQTCKNTILNIHKKFIGFGGQKLISNGNTISMVFVDQPIYCIGKDDKNRSIYTVIYDVRVQSTGDVYRL